MNATAATAATVRPAMRIRSRSVETNIDLETAAAKTVTARIHYKLIDQTIEAEGLVGDHGIIECVGDGRGWRYTTSLHSPERCTILDGLPGWLPPLPAGWDIPAIEFAADMAEAVSA